MSENNYVHVFSLIVKNTIILLEYFMTHRSGVVTILPEVTTNRVVPMLSSSLSARLHCNLFIFTTKNPHTTLKICQLESAVCAHHSCPNPLFLGDVLIELLFYQFLQVRCIIGFRLKESIINNKHLFIFALSLFTKHLNLLVNTFLH